jgi:homoserine dehydrogenase
MSAERPTTTSERSLASAESSVASPQWVAAPGESSASSPERVAGAGGSFNVGLLGFGTVGSAFAALLSERATHIEALTGRVPALGEPLTTSKGSFAAILSDSDLIVELIGGIEPARDYVLSALRAGKHVVTANKQLLSHHGEELFEAARASGVQLRFEAAVAGVVPVIRVLCESLAGAHVERIHGIVNGTTNFILSEMTRGSSYEQALAEAQRQGYAEADPSDDVSGRDAAAKMAILARLAFATPVHIDQVPYEGIEHLQTDDLQYARELGLGLKLIGTAERRDGGLSVRVHPAFLYSGHPLASVSGPFNAVTVESDAITEITMSGPGAGGRQTASAVLGDLVSAMLPLGAPSAPLDPLPLVQDVESGFYIHMEVADTPGTLASIASVLGEQGASIKSVAQHGLGEHARLVMVIHPLSESRVREALKRIAALDFLRSTPRAIRVIEEEFM